ncbi:MAG: fasciclin domain-containing protein [Actinomycetota bacterium]
MFEILQSDERFSTYFGLIQEFGPEVLLSHMRANTWDHTLLVPVNGAFDALSVGALDDYTASEDAFVEFFDAHSVGGTVVASELGETPLAVAGLIEVTVDGDTVTYGRATVIEADIEARNGMVHAVDTVLFPEDFGA